MLDLPVTELSIGFQPRAGMEHERSTIRIRRLIVGISLFGRTGQKVTSVGQQRNPRTLFLRSLEYYCRKEGQTSKALPSTRADFKIVGGLFVVSICCFHLFTVTNSSRWPLSEHFSLFWPASPLLADSPPLPTLLSPSPGETCEFSRIFRDGRCQVESGGYAL